MLEAHGAHAAPEAGQENPWTPGGGLRFALLAASGAARRGRFWTAHGPVDTPGFMPVGTQGAVKCATPAEVAATGAQVVLANTYHLSLKERTALVERLGGLHAMMRWGRAILTDSGGFQVFSLPERRITEEGVRFRYEEGGEPVLLTPERSMEVQRILGADLVMAFDECVDHRAEAGYLFQSTERTERWLQRCLAAPLQPHQHLLPIVQGGLDLDLRARCAGRLAAYGAPAYAIGGVSVGEGHEQMVRVVRHTAPLLPADRPRYLMGVGLPEDLVESVACGMDIHDCVIPTRYAREGTVFTWDGKLRLNDARFRKDRYPVDTACACPACAGGFSRAYLRHLFWAKEPLFETLATLHNLRFYQELMAAMRGAIETDGFAAWREAFRARYFARRERGREGRG